LNNLSNVFIPFQEPVIRPNVYGILPYDVPHRVVAWGIFSMPKQIKFSPIVDLHSGQPYSNIDTLQNYVGTPNGQRFGTFFTLDVKVYRQGASCATRVLLAQRHESWKLQRGVQQRDSAEFRAVRRLYGSARRSGHRLCGLNEDFVKKIEDQNVSRKTAAPTFKP
jgi:hypothetical protein